MWMGPTLLGMCRGVSVGPFSHVGGFEADETCLRQSLGGILRVDIWLFFLVLLVSEVLPIRTHPQVYSLYSMASTCSAACVEKTGFRRGEGRALLTP